MMLWKVKAFCKIVWYEAASWVLKQRIKRAWARAGMMQDELERIKEISKGRSSDFR